MRCNEHDALLFGRNLYLARRRRGLSGERLAELANMSRDGICKIERGQRAPRLATLLTLADTLGVDPCELLKGLRPARGGTPSALPQEERDLMDLSRTSSRGQG